MGYFIIEKPAPPPNLFHQICMAALLRFRSRHTIEMKPEFDLDPLLRVVTITAGESETYSFEELGFQF